MRKLAIGALSFSAAVYAACFFLPKAFLFPLSALLLAAGSVFLIKNRKRFRALIICCFALSLGFLCFFTADRNTLSRAEKHQGEEEDVSAILLDYPYRGEGYQSFTVEIEDGDLSGLKAKIYHRGEPLVGAEPGDRLSFNAKFKSSAVKYGERSFSLTSKGIYLVGNTLADIKTEKAGFSLSAFPERLNHHLAELTDELFPEDCSAFMKSLLLGDKSDYYKEEGLSSYMSRAGLAHIVAISGLHIVYLVGFMKSLLGNSRRSSVLGILLAWFFVILTGSSHSAVRAGIMQTLLLAAPLVDRENDPITSLSAALAFILLVNPFAAGSIGLQLSFSATAGIMCFSGRINDYLMGHFKTVRAKKIMCMPAASVAASVGSMIFTLPLTAYHFGYVSLYSPLSNVLCFWAVSLCFCGGLICCLIGLFIKGPAVILAALISWPARYIMFIAEFIAELPMALVYMDSPYGLYWLILSYSLFVLASGIWDKVGKRLMIPMLVSLSFLIFSHSLSCLSYKNCGGVTTALDTGQGQCLCLISGDRTVLYDCGGTGCTRNAGDVAAAYLKGRGRNKIDLLILSHMQKDHVNGVERLAEQCEIEEIIIPHFDYSYNSFYEEVRDCAYKNGIELKELSSELNMEVGDIQLKLFACTEPRDINDSSINMLAGIGSFQVLATGDASKAWEKELIEERDFPDIELLIAGHHGSKNSGCDEFLRKVDADAAIISCGYNSYGHPSEEILERLSNCGYNILRTDLDSTVEIRIGRDYG